MKRYYLAQFEGWKAAQALYLRALFIFVALSSSMQPARKISINANTVLLYKLI